MNRHEKLQKLNENKGNGMVIMTDGAPFIKALEDKINDLKTALGVSVDVDATELIEELKNIKLFVPAIKELIESLDGIEIPPIPEIPKSITVDGLKDITKAFTDQIALLQRIANIKMPDISVQVETINQKNADNVTKKINELIKTNDGISVLNKEVAKSIVDKIANLIEVVNNNKPPEQSQAPADYVPMRRVKKVGNILVFDDDAWGGGNSGGGGLPPGVIKNGVAVAIVNTDGSGIDNSSAIYDGTTPVTPKFAVISASNIGDNAIVAAVTSKKIRVLSYALVSSGTVNVKWQSDVTDISGLMYFIANTGISAGYNPKGHFQTNKGEELQLNLSAGQAVGGHISYIEVD